MADVFISYAREDRSRAEELASAIVAKGWTVWWDHRIPVGKSFSSVIEAELAAARCVLVIWSGSAVKSEWVKNEAAEGTQRNILVPVRIEDVQIPFQFRHLHTADLTQWRPGVVSRELEACFSAIGSLVEPSAAAPTRLDATFTRAPPPLPPLPKRFRHHVVFSYASADAEYVRAVHAALPEEVDVFDYADRGMWGEELVKGLERRYKNEALFCVVFISKSYLKSPWTQKELAIVSRVAKRKPGYMLPVVLDGTIVPEIEDIAWLDKTLTPEQLAARLVAKIREPPPKPWWFYVSMWVKVAAAAALLALILFMPKAINYIRPSHTEVKSVQADAEAITAHIVNSGPKSATIVGQRLMFGALPIEDKELRLDASATIAPGEHDVKLTALELLTKCDADGIRPNKNKVEPLLDQQPVRLVIEIQESDDAPDQSTPRIVPIPASLLKPLVLKLVSGRDTPC